MFVEELSIDWYNHCWGRQCLSMLKMCIPYDSVIALINTYFSLRIKETYTLVPEDLYKNMHISLMVEPKCLQ